MSNIGIRKKIRGLEAEIRELREELGEAEDFSYVSRPNDNEKRDLERKFCHLRREVNRLVERKRDEMTLTVYQIEEYCRRAFRDPNDWDLIQLSSFMQKNDLDIVDDPHEVTLKRGDCPEHIKEILKFCFEDHN